MNRRARAKPRRLTAAQQRVCEDLIPLARATARQFPGLIDAENEAYLSLCKAVRDWFAKDRPPGSIEPFVFTAIRNDLIDAARRAAPPTIPGRFDREGRPVRARFLSFHED